MKKEAQRQAAFRWRRKKEMNTALANIVELLRTKCKYTAPTQTIEEATEIAKKLDKKFLQGRRTDMAMASALYLACENCACPIPTEIMRKGLWNPEEYDEYDVRFLRGKSTHFKNTLAYLRIKLNRHYPSDPIHWKVGIFNRLKRQLPRISPVDLAHLERTFEELCRKHELYAGRVGKSSRLQALGLLYIAGILSNVKLTQLEISQLFFLTEVSIRNAFKKIGEVNPELTTNLFG